MKAHDHGRRFPGETSEYRAKRNELLEAELALRDQVEKVAAMRRGLPVGGVVPTDYVFQEGSRDFRDTLTVKDVRLSDLFEGNKSTLVMIQLMFNPAKEAACPMCTMWADTYNAAAPHLLQRVNFVLVAKAEPKKLRAWGAAREWRNLRLLSSHGNTFNRDYHGENSASEGDLGDGVGGQNAGIAVFTKKDGKVHHTYSIEGAFPTSSKGDPRHIDLYSPVWQLLDLSPEGRGEWYPKYSYV